MLCFNKQKGIKGYFAKYNGCSYDGYEGVEYVEAFSSRESRSRWLKKEGNSHWIAISLKNAIKILDNCKLGTCTSFTQLY